MSPPKRQSDADLNGPASKRIKTADDQRPPATDFYTTPIVLEIDDSGHNFHCHQELLRHKAPLLYEKCNIFDGTTEQPPVFDVPDIGARMMNIFLVWLYTGEVIPPFDHDQLPGVDDASSRDGEANAGGNDRLYVGPRASTLDALPFMEDLELVEVFVFAQKYLIKELLKKAMTELVSSATANDRSATANAVNKAYAELPRDSLLIRYLLQVSYQDINTLSFPHSASAFCPDYIADVLKTIRRDPLGRMQGQIYPEDHQVHDGGEMEVKRAPEVTSSAWNGSRSAGSVSPYALINGGMSTILVGPEQQPFVIHKDYLSHCSEYFRSAFNGRFTEATSGQLCLDNESVRTFSQFLVWMYEGHIRIPPRESYERIESQSRRSVQGQHDARPERGQITDDVDGFLDLPEAEEGQDWIQLNLIELYIFADRRDIPALRNDIMTRLITEGEQTDENGCGWDFTTTFFDHVRLVFESLPIGSRLRIYLVQEAAWFWTEREYANTEMYTLPPVFLAEVLSGTPHVRKKREEEGYKRYALWREALCLFHEHNDQKRAPAHECLTKHKKLRQTLYDKMALTNEEENEIFNRRHASYR